MIHLYRKFLIALFVILVVLLAMAGGCMYVEKYQMAIRTTPSDPEYPDWPARKKYFFDASKWLKDSRYIKSNDFYLINVNYPEIDNLYVYDITIELQNIIRESYSSFPELSPLGDMDAKVFLQKVSGGLSSEYIFSQFDEKTLEPTDDWFLIGFSYNGMKYEAVIVREIYNNKYIYVSRGIFVYKPGEWYKRNGDLLTWRSYMKRKNSH